MTLLDRLGISIPIIQAPMAGVQHHALAAAVSSAGGLGSLPCAMLGADALRAELAALRSATGAPFNVNFFCHVPPVPDPEGNARWRALLAPYYEELGIDAEVVSTAPARQPFDDAAADVLEEFRPSVVSFHFGLPAPRLLARVRGWGAVMLATATSIEEARWLEARGVDAIVAQGVEAGGHRGWFLTPSLERAADTLSLVRQLTQVMSVPVIAAGGIADRCQVENAIAHGAAAVQVGTAYLLCDEATTGPVHRAALQGDGAGNTAFTNLFSGRIARGIVNRVMRELGPIHPRAPEFPLAAAAMAPLRAAAERQGRSDFSPLWAGESARACRAVPAARLTRELGGRSQ
ncbi:NAD(P)H-dependent flavin oxidoreductase [Lysobacter yangpyeongensis]|uniref:Propionate 3-nitronate monooxygenase n=1 Tax=Lysobacter yangpyeongensis TaxID=346182 RepID=A0ABW0SLL5_9GAMM